jgi:uncharacterized protein (TIGR03435 family)
MRIVSSLIFLTSIAAFSQTSDSPAFEVASIKSVQPGKEIIEPGPGSVNLRNVRLSAAIRWAYNLQEPQLSGPGWMNDTWFDIWAKAATPVKESEVRVMLQTLLAQRFKLAIHRETKEVPVLVVTVAKSGHKLQPAESEGSPSFETGNLMLTGKGATVPQLTAFLSKELRTPIIDQTGLSGRYNYVLDINAYVPDEMRHGGPDGGPPADGAAIVAQVMQIQLGLKLDTKKTPLELVIVDHMEKVPTEN